jgi:hypothetical protein
MKQSISTETKEITVNSDHCWFCETYTAGHAFCSNRCETRWFEIREPATIRHMTQIAKSEAQALALWAAPCR